MKPHFTASIRTVCHSVLGAVLVGIGVRTSVAVPVQDQSVVPDKVNFSSSIFDWAPKAQTFTVGIAGTLTEVDVYIWRTVLVGPLMFDLLRTKGGLPDEAQALFPPLSIPAASVPGTLGWLSIDVSSYGVTVAGGDVLAIELVGTTANSDYQWYGPWKASYDSYAQGSSWHKYPNWASDGSGYDLGFRTYVEPIPEPSSLLLCGIGIVGLAGFRSDLFGLRLPRGRQRLPRGRHI